MPEQTPEPTPCPLCGYSLAGLPNNHRCPECGFAYDEHTRVWRVAPTKLRYAQFTTPIICLVVFVVALWPIFQNHSGRTFHLVFVAAVLTCFGWIIRSAARMTETEEKGRCVAITPRGLFVRDFTGEEWIEWANLGRIVLSPDFNYITRSNSVRTTPIPLTFSDEEAKAAFIATIEHARMAYRSGVPTLPNSPNNLSINGDP